MEDFIKKIDLYVKEHENDIIRDIIRVCRFNSQKSEAGENMPFGEGVYKCLIDTLSLAQGYGFKTKNYDNYVGTIDLNDNVTELDILAHLDVVPEGENWTACPPFEPIVKDGKIYGRGTSDDKGPAIAALYALKAFKDLNINLSKNVRLILGTDEECGGACIEHYFKYEKSAPMTFTPDSDYPVTNIEKGRLNGKFKSEYNEEKNSGVISIKAGTKLNVVPPKACAVIKACDESLLINAVEELKKFDIKCEYKKDKDLYEIEVLGLNAHAMAPQNGKNALTALLLLISKLNLNEYASDIALNNLYNLLPHNDYYAKSLGIDVEDEKSGKLTLNFSILNYENGILKGEFDLRAPVSSKPDFILKTLNEKFNEIGIEFLSKSMIAPHEVDENSEFVKTLNECYEKITGNKGGCISTGGGTYVHDIENGVAFGAVFPGTDTNMHSIDEFVVIEQILTSVKIFALAIYKLCK